MRRRVSACAPPVRRTCRCCATCTPRRACPNWRCCPGRPGSGGTFTDDQFRLQHSHFVRHFARADFWMVVRDGMPIGRLYLDRASVDWRIVGILLSIETRGQGIGTALIGWMQRGVAAAGAGGIALSVAVNNPRAHALYRRLGFVDTGAANGMHQPMLWHPTAAA